MVGDFLKIPQLNKILEIQDWKKTTKFIQKRKFQIKSQTNDWKLSIRTLSIRKQTSKTSW